MQNILFFIRKYVKDLVVFALIFICFGLIVYNIYLTEEKKSEINEKLAMVSNKELVVKEETNEDINAEELIYVDIKGAIKKPGVYQVNKNSIINDIITLAGGFNSNAYTNGINLSKKVADEMVIYVYTKDEIKNSTVKDTNTNVTENAICNVPSYNICECIDNKESIIENGSINKTEDNKSSLVNINTANVTELTTLSGIGESKAQSIVDYRNNNGAFKAITDIMNVTGIGQSIFDKIKNNITI